MIYYENETPNKPNDYCSDNEQMLLNKTLANNKDLKEFSLNENIINNSEINNDNSNDLSIKINKNSNRKKSINMSDDKNKKRYILSTIDTPRRSMIDTPQQATKDDIPDLVTKRMMRAVSVEQEEKLSCTDKQL